MNEYVLLPWVETLPLKMQSALIASLRGGDGLSNIDISKPLIKNIRGLIVKSVSDETVYLSKIFDKENINKFIDDLDRYNVHFVTHLIQAISIISYKHPVDSVRKKWFKVYLSIAKKLNLNILTKEQMEEEYK